MLGQLSTATYGVVQLCQFSVKIYRVNRASLSLCRVTVDSAWTTLYGRVRSCPIARVNIVAQPAFTFNTCACALSWRSVCLRFNLYYEKRRWVVHILLAYIACKRFHAASSDCIKVRVSRWMKKSNAIILIEWTVVYSDVGVLDVSLYAWSRIEVKLVNEVLIFCAYRQRHLVAIGTPSRVEVAILIEWLGVRKAKQPGLQTSFMDLFWMYVKLQRI